MAAVLRELKKEEVSYHVKQSTSLPHYFVSDTPNLQEVISEEIFRANALGWCIEWVGITCSFSPKYDELCKLLYSCTPLKCCINEKQTYVLS